MTRFAGLGIFTRMLKTPVYYTTSQLAGWCDVDAKTIVNWVDRGSIAAIKTPGGHRRFRPADVLAFLEARGFDVPAEVRAAAEAPKSAAA